MSIIDQLYKLIDETEFSERVKDRVKELSIKSKLNQGSGVEESKCLTLEEWKELGQLIKADMVLDTIEVECYKACLAEVDKAIAGLKE
ncbi:MAG: hypothetical protein KYQ20_00020 [Candidatus Nealsonbacteria bacterium]|nr:hypothetical protein [Candidatus Nealsonbacteria bacterium]